MPTVQQRHGLTDGHTDGRTTYSSNTALALRASRGKNWKFYKLPETLTENSIIPGKSRREFLGWRIPGNSREFPNGNSRWPCSAVRHTEWPNKKRATKILSWLRQIPTNFKNCFSIAPSNGFAIKWWLKIPPHLKHVAALPCDVLVSAFE